MHTTMLLNLWELSLGKQYRSVQQRHHCASL